MSVVGQGVVDLAGVVAEHSQQACTAVVSGFDAVVARSYVGSEEMMFGWGEEKQVDLGLVVGTCWDYSCLAPVTLASGQKHRGQVLTAVARRSKIHYSEGQRKQGERFVDASWCGEVAISGPGTGQQNLWLGILLTVSYSGMVWAK